MSIEKRDPHPLKPQRGGMTKNVHFIPSLPILSSFQTHHYYSISYNKSILNIIQIKIYKSLNTTNKVYNIFKEEANCIHKNR